MNEKLERLQKEKLDRLQTEADEAWTEYQRATESVKPYFDRWDKAVADVNRENMRQEIREEISKETAVK